MPRRRALSPQQKEFVREYFKDFNATQAAIRAKYNPKCAHDTGCRLLKKAEVQVALAKVSEKEARKAEITPERVLDEEKCIAFCDVRQIFDSGIRIHPKDLPEEIARAVAGIDIIENEVTGVTTYKYRFWDKGKALERLSKHLGLYEKDNKQRSAAEALRAFLEAVNGRTRGLPRRVSPVQGDNRGQVDETKQSLLGSGQVGEQNTVPVQ